MGRPAAPLLRAFEPDDVKAFVGLWNAVLERDPISPDAFSRQTLRDPNFSPAGCWLAERDGKPVGCVLAVAPGKAHLFGQPPGIGRISGLGVLPVHRRKGIGSALLERALGFLKERSCRRAVVAAPEYYVAGLDCEAYPAGQGFLQARGFSFAGEAVAMGRMLYDLEWPVAVREAEAKLARDGVRIGRLKPEEAPALMDFFRSEFPSWAEFFTRKQETGAPFNDIVVAAAGGKVVGFCQRLEADHIGPFGVAEAWRNRGVGSVMLYRLLETMRRDGFRFAWFGETGRAQPYYERAGFQVTRRYRIAVRDLI